MPSFSFNTFGGSIPRLEPHLLPRNAAAKALDCKLWSGSLASWRESQHVRDVAEGTRTVELIDGCWHEFPSHVSIAEGPVNCRRRYVTGWYPFPVVMEMGSGCQPEVRRLGVPCGEEAPLVLPGALNDSAEKDIESRSYAYQYVDVEGNRGALSQGSAPQLIRDGQTVAVSGWAIPPPEWGVVSVRIYRAVPSVGSSMPTLQNTMQNTMDTSWLFVGEVPIASAAFSDTLRNEVLISAVEEDVVQPPPAALQGITHIAAMNCLVGFVGKTLYFSENNHYHNWPFTHDLDDNICAIVESNGAIYVATDGHPYVLPAHANCEQASCRTPLRLPVAFPFTGCGNKSMVALAQGAVFPSHDGLVGLAGGNMPQLVTFGLYSPDDWKKLIPQSVKLAVTAGRLYCFAARGAFSMTLAQGAEQGWSLDNHTELSDRVDNVFVTRNGVLYLLRDNAVWVWDRGTQLRPHLWVSPDVVAPTELNYAAGHVRVHGGGEEITIYADGREVYQRDVLSNKQFRLPNWAIGTRWKIALEGTGEVTLAAIATSMRELTA